MKSSSAAMAGVFLLVYISVNLFLKCQGQKINQAKIFSENTEIPEGGRLEVTCSTFGFTEKPVHLYLCKNGKAIDMKNKPTQTDTVFKIERIQTNHSGNYSCVYSEEQLQINKVMGSGHNYIFINVIESFIYTQINLVKSEISVGSNAEINCTTSNPLHNKQSTNMILVYLIKNGKPIEVNIWDTERMMTIFTLREVQMEDAGTYSCVVLLNILPYHGMTLHQNIKLDLQIIATSNSGIDKVLTVIMCSVVLLLSLFLGIWALIRKRGCLGIQNERSSINETELRGSNLLYEDIDKPDLSGTVHIQSSSGSGHTQRVIWAGSELDDSSFDDEE